ncbi:MAG TPA: ABC transporter substrate binding protein [Vicinamibacterales bacterium]|nr:ABC transporter substrate binding protein [Vicinamibacterales bacterium]
MSAGTTRRSRRRVRRSADLGWRHRRAAGDVVAILKGTAPGSLPVQRPTKFQLVINRNTAKLLGLGIPQSLLTLADQLIE